MSEWDKLACCECGKAPCGMLPDPDRGGAYVCWDCLQVERTRLRAERDALKDALDCLAGELKACMGMAEWDIRTGVGNTNYGALENRLNIALALLEGE